MGAKEENIDKDTRILAQFIEVYCENKHPGRDKIPWVPTDGYSGSIDKMSPLLCQDCADLLNYSADRRRLCPLDPKPTCKKCEIHCYAPENRAKIREVMRFSGMQLIKRGRFDMIFHFFF